MKSANVHMAIDSINAICKRQFVFDLPWALNDIAYISSNAR